MYAVIVGAEWGVVNADICIENTREEAEAVGEKLVELGWTGRDGYKIVRCVPSVDLIAEAEAA